MLVSSFSVLSLIGEPVVYFRMDVCWTWNLRTYGIFFFKKSLYPKSLLLIFHFLHFFFPTRFPNITCICSLPSHSLPYTYSKIGKIGILNFRINEPFRNGSRGFAPLLLVTHSQIWLFPVETKTKKPRDLVVSKPNKEFGWFNQGPFFCLASLPIKGDEEEAIKGVSASIIHYLSSC